jgi:two-component system, cell cycle sensor histidine kinase and response regulator CckA
VYGIVTQAGGQLRIYSEAGLGTTFTAYLPATTQQAAPRGHGEMVLVVEDEPAMREVTRRLLARNGYQVTAVAGGQEALAALTHRPAPRRPASRSHSPPAI